MYEWLQRVWYQNAPSGVLLRPLSWLFAGLVSLRRWLYERGLLRSRSVGVPVVVVGNLTVGGSGKTPFTLWLAGQLRGRGVKAGIVLRGYGATNKEPRLVTDASTYEDVGDEALLLAARSGCPVAVGVDRVGAARLLVEQGVELIIADDGLQHLALARDMEVVVIDGSRRLGNGRLLPAGPLREPAGRLRTVDAVVVNGGSADEGEISMTLEPGLAYSLAPGGGEKPLTAFAPGPVHAVAAIGNPERFFRMLEAHGIGVIRHPFPDHHPLRTEDLRFGDGRPVLMTEKDAVKCRNLASGAHWCVPVRARVQEPHGNRLVDSVIALLGARTG